MTAAPLLYFEPRAPVRTGPLAVGFGVNLVLVLALALVRYEPTMLEWPVKPRNTVLLAPLAAPLFVPAPIKLKAPPLVVPRLRVSNAISAPPAPLPVAIATPAPLNPVLAPPVPRLIIEKPRPAPPPVIVGLFGSPPVSQPKLPLARIAEVGTFADAPANSAAGRGSAATVQINTFEATAAGAHEHAPVPARQLTRGIEILSKPKPEYSEEARQLKIEGDVVLEMLFQADGKAKVNRILHSLGHGLDENATRAATLIRFRPAESGSQSIDQLATVRVQFQLAQ